MPWHTSCILYPNLSHKGSVGDLKATPREPTPSKGSSLTLALLFSFLKYLLFFILSSLCLHTLLSSDCHTIETCASGPLLLGSPALYFCSPLHLARLPVARWPLIDASYPRSLPGMSTSRAGARGVWNTTVRPSQPPPPTNPRLFLTIASPPLQPCSPLSRDTIQL